MENSTFVELMALEMATQDIAILDKIQSIVRDTPEPKSSLDRQLARDDIHKLLQMYYWSVRNKAQKTTSRQYLKQGMVNDSGT